jgi:thiamine kinase-like enzyme
MDLIEDDLAVRSYLCEVMDDCSADRIQVVDRLRSGENHTVYRVSYRDLGGESRQVVVRVGSGEPAGILRAEREAKILGKVGRVAGPELYDFSATTQWFKGPVMCMDFISGEQREMKDTLDEDLQRLGTLVRRLHGLPIDDLNDWQPRQPDLLSYIEERWLGHVLARLSTIRYALPMPVQRRLQEAVDLASDSAVRLRELVELDANQKLVLLHADISGPNLIWAPRPVLIDWEYARLGDPADEVAYLFTQNQLSPPQNAAFWSGYVPGLGDGELDSMTERVRHWEPITLLGSVLWWLDAWSRSDELASSGRTDPALSRPADYYLGQALRRLEHFESPIG